MYYPYSGLNSARLAANEGEIGERQSSTTGTDLWSTRLNYAFRDLTDFGSADST